jgi:hypothetical protein
MHPQRYAGTRFEELRQLHLPQKHKATVLDSTLRIEMNGLEEQADNAQARDLYWKPLSWLGTSKVGLTAAKAAALRINLNVEGCGIVAAPVHAPSRAPLLLPLLLSHNLPLPRVH